MFNSLQLAVQRKFTELKTHNLYRTTVDKDQLWELYLKSFPEGSNPMFKKRTEHDCQCCKNFIRAVGGMVAIVDCKLVSIWDVTVDYPYQDVANALSKFVKAHPIENLYVHYERSLGVAQNFKQTEDGVVTFNHFHLQLTPQLVMKNDAIGTALSDLRATRDVLYRGLKELTVDSFETVIDLIKQNSLYRGEEHLAALQEFLKLKKKFDTLKAAEQDLFCWSLIKQVPPHITRLRNTAIGSLIVDLSEGKDLEPSVAAFESKVAPTNYRRPTALVTKGMIEKAQKKIEELGLTASLDRRFAVVEDISVNNVLFADRGAKKRMANNVFEELASTVPNKKTFDKVEEISIDNFIGNILPKIESMEVMLENKHSTNLVSLIAPMDLTAKTLFKWPNNFSWSYAGELADSIKERVKKAGGRVDGDLRCSLSWFNFDDLDLHMTEPDKFHIYFRDKISRSTGGNLDVDMNAGSGHTRTPVENICYPDRRKMKEGIYKLNVHQFSRRETSNVGFDVEIEFDGNIQTFSYAKALKQDETVTVAHIKYTSTKGFEIVESIPSTHAVKTMWNLPTQSFHKVSMMMLSPNHWNDQAIGNKHYFFMLDGCINDGKARGFFNEFLAGELNEHRKVFEIVGSKLKVQETPNQLSGLGFSSTQRNSVLCKVTGNFARTVKIIF